MGISHRHGDGLVAEKLLHGADVNASHHEATGERMSETMPTKTRNLGVRESWLEPAARPRGSPPDKAGAGTWPT